MVVGEDFAADFGEGGGAGVEIALGSSVLVFLALLVYHFDG